MDDYEFDSDEDELRDEEYPDEDELDDDSEVEPDLVHCPACGVEIFEDSVRCPVCGEYVTFSTNPLSNWPIGWIALGVIGVIATLWALVTLAR